ncbi:hypothetical protein ABFT23_21950 [Nocardioides sp. C4-1]|uniref:hypothetical protein n=1 Tax=Nocardioides sp. C4-1 TaxID=3151851 RepID=UPI003266E4B4
MSGDQQWQRYRPGATTPEPTPRPTKRATSRTGTAIGLAIGAVAVVAAVGTVGAVVVAEVRDAVAPPDALSAEGLDDLRADVEAASGGTEVFRAVVYPEYASLDVPVDGDSQRYRSMHWDGDLDEFGGKGTSSYTRVDLADVDPALVTRAVAEVRPLVEDATSWYVIIDGPMTGIPGEDAATLSAYASNEYSETAYVEYTLEGIEVRRYVDGEVVTPST